MGRSSSTAQGSGVFGGRSARGQSEQMNREVQDRYYSQQEPMAQHMGFNYGRGSEADFGAFNDIMGRYKSYFDDPESGGKAKAAHAGYKDPFESYGGYKEFSQTGGYSPEDIANMRARGTSPIRAAYQNAQREMGRQRSLQGGYGPNYMASMAKMARDQSQGMADAQQNVEAGLAEARNKGRLAGLGGMSGIEGQRLGADVDVSKFNAMADMNTDQFNQQFGAGNRLNALQGMTGLYGTTPGMSNMFGNQLLNAVGQGGQMGLGYLGQQNVSGQLPGGWETGMGMIGDVGDIAAGTIYPWMQNRMGGGNASRNQMAQGGWQGFGGGGRGGVGRGGGTDWGSLITDVAGKYF